jgi:protein-disulfide isomerase
MRYGALAMVLFGLWAAGCGKKNGAGTQDEYKDIAKSFDDSEPPPDKRKPVEGADLGKLSDVDKQRFEKLVDSLPSPCGKSHSLRTSRNSDAECVRARFAVDYVIALIGDGANDDEVREMYKARYGKEEAKKSFKISDAVPHAGPVDARVVLVEFFDFGCPACQEFAPQLKEVIAAYPTDLVIYYKQFPLEVHEDSKGAAQAALAAHKQGKYLEYHELLFANPNAHKKDALVGYARKLGLDMKKWEADYAAAEAQVNADKQEGEQAGVASTPTLYINGREYGGPQWAKYVKMWIEEELAVNR